MGDHRHAAGGRAVLRLGRIACRFDGTGSAGEGQAFSLGIHLDLLSNK